MLRSTPPVTTASNWCWTSPSIEAARAASVEAQAASTTKLGPCRSNRLATRPAMQLPSSPGMVSSVIWGRCAPMRSCISAMIAARTSAGNARNDGAPARSRTVSGKATRRAVW